MNETPFYLHDLGDTTPGSQPYVAPPRFYKQYVVQQSPVVCVPRERKLLYYVNLQAVEALDADGNAQKLPGNYYLEQGTTRTLCYHGPLDGITSLHDDDRFALPHPLRSRHNGFYATTSILADQQYRFEGIVMSRDQLIRVLAFGPAYLIGVVYATETPDLVTFHEVSDSWGEWMQVPLKLDLLDERPEAVVPLRLYRGECQHPASNTHNTTSWFYIGYALQGPELLLQYSISEVCKNWGTAPTTKVTEKLLGEILAGIAVQKQYECIYHSKSVRAAEQLISRFKHCGLGMISELINDQNAQFEALGTGLYFD